MLLGPARPSLRPLHRRRPPGATAGLSSSAEPPRNLTLLGKPAVAPCARGAFHFTRLTPPTSPTPSAAEWRYGIHGRVAQDERYPDLVSGRNAVLAFSRLSCVRATVVPSMQLPKPSDSAANMA